MMPKQSRSTLIPWFAALLFFVTLMIISDHLKEIPIQEDICELKKCKPYEDYMRQIHAKKAQWQELDKKRQYVAELDQVFENCQNQISKIEKSSPDNTDEKQLKKIHSDIAQCQKTIEKKLQELKSCADQTC